MHNPCRPINVAHTLLVAVPAPGLRCLRISYAPESRACCNVAVWAGVVVFLATYSLFVLLTLAWIFLVPVAGLAVAAAAVGLALAGRRLSLDRVVAAWEGVLVALLLGVHATQLPLAPPPEP